MNNLLKIQLLLILISLLSGCGGAPKSANKWLDYGNGVINLTNATTISFDDTSITIDGFVLSLLTISDYDYEMARITSMATESPDITKKEVKEASKILEKQNEMVQERQNEVSKFIKSSKTYYSL